MQASYSDRVLVAPPGFQPNSTFFGFQRELKRLDMALHDQSRRSMGTCSVLVWGPPGSGKTHLVRQYLWTHRDSYPEGIFWIDGRSQESRLKSFWDIVETVSLVEKAGLTEEPSYGQAEFVETVRKWLESKEGWLMVFDGVSFDTEDHLFEAMRFLPNRTGNNIVYTSVDRNLAKRVRLFSPEAIEVQPLSEEDACRLLYDRLNIQHPSSKQEAKAKELVNYFQCLPLAIHATAHRINARGQALEKFNVESTTTDQRLAEPFNGIIQDLTALQHFEAINLINILAFFDHHIPVGIIQLGRRALSEFNIEIRSMDRPGSLNRNLDETIATLIRHGLCERALQRFPLARRGQARGNDATHSKGDLLAEPEASTQEDSSFESSSTTSSSYTIDVLRVHSVVQGFCRDDLRDRQEFELWLIVAVKLFCLSYQMADAKMKGATGEALTRDYREFETHAARLRHCFPHKAKHNREPFRQVRRELDETITKITAQIDHGSPVQSFKSEREGQQISVFDISGSSSSGGPTTPSSTPSRTLTWGPIGETMEESPIDIDMIARHGTDLQRLIVPNRLQPEAGGYGSELDVPSGTFESSTVSPVTSEDIEHSIHIEPANSRSADLQAPHSFLRHLIQGRHARAKDLGDWHPMPTQPAVTPVAALAESAMRPRAISFGQSSTSAGSEAEAALAAVHRVSPPASRGGGPRSLSRPRRSSENQSPAWRYATSRRGSNSSIPEQVTDFGRGRQASHSTSPLANTYDPESYSSRLSADQLPTLPPGSSTRSRVSDLGIVGMLPLPIEENITITSPRQPPPDAVATSRDIVPPMSSFDPSSLGALPSGYTSTPMSRDVSQESQMSQNSEPARYTSAFATSPELRESIREMQRKRMLNSWSVGMGQSDSVLQQQTSASATTRPPYPVGDAEIMPSEAATQSRRNSLGKVHVIGSAEVVEGHLPGESTRSSAGKAPLKENVPP